MDLLWIAMLQKKVCHTYFQAISDNRKRRANSICKHNIKDRMFGEKISILKEETQVSYIFQIECSVFLCFTFSQVSSVLT